MVIECQKTQQLLGFLRTPTYEIVRTTVCSYINDVRTLAQSGDEIFYKKLENIKKINATMTPERPVLNLSDKWPHVRGKWKRAA